MMFSFVTFYVILLCIRIAVTILTPEAMDKPISSAVASLSVAPNFVLDSPCINTPLACAATRAARHISPVAVFVRTLRKRLPGIASPAADPVVAAARDAHITPSQFRALIPLCAMQQLLYLLLPSTQFHSRATSRLFHLPE